MFSGVLAGTLTVPISLLIAVQLIDNARSRQAATAWKTFWGPVQKERLDLSAAPLASADQSIAKCVDALGATDPDKVRLAVLDANHWLPTTRGALAVATNYIEHYAETAQDPALLMTVERLGAQVTRYASLVEMYTRELLDSRHRTGRDETAELAMDARILIHEARQLSDCIRHLRTELSERGPDAEARSGSPASN